MAYGRRSNNDLAYGDDYYPQRWDRDRYEQARRGGPPSRESNSFRYEEDDRYGPRGGYRRDVEVDDRYTRSGPRGTTYVERDRFYEDDRYGPSRRGAPSYLDDSRNYTQSRQLAPYRPRYEEDYNFSSSRRSSGRPGPIRRQSSFDGHDRPPPSRGYPRDDEQDVNVTVNVNSAGDPGPRRGEEYGGGYDHYNPGGRDPYRDSYRDSYRETDYYDDEDYRDVRIRRERDRSVFRRNPEYDSRRSGEYDYEYESRSSYDQYNDPPPRRSTRRGKTRMPKRMVHRKAIIECGYPFEEEEFFFIIKIALNKDEIDVVIKLSEGYFREERVSVSISETKQLEAPPAPQPPEEVIEKVTTRVIENPTDEEYERYKNQGTGNDSFSENVSIHEQRDGGRESYHFHESVHEGSNAGSKQSRRSSSSSETERGSVHQSQQGGRSSYSRRSRRESDREVIVDNERDGVEIDKNRRTNNLELVVPVRSKSRRRDGDDIKSEIRALEEEKRRIRDDNRDSAEVEIVDARDYRDSRREVVFDKRSKSRNRSRRPSNKLAEAALFTLT